MGQACGKNKYVAPLEALEDDGNYEWCNDLDTFMQVVMNQGEVFGIPSESTMEMASRGLLDCPFENDKQKHDTHTTCMLNIQKCKTLPQEKSVHFP